MIAMSAYDYEEMYCCNEGNNFYYKQSNTICSGEVVLREDCERRPKCKDACKTLFTSIDTSHKRDFISAKEYWELAGQITDLKRHTDSVLSLQGQGTGSPFAISGRMGSIIFVSFKGGDWTTSSTSKVPADKFTVQKWNLENDQPALFANKGFISDYNGLKLSVFNHVGKMMTEFPATELHVSGQSLGGALATLGAVDLTAKYPHVKVALWTFGAPSVFRETDKKPDTETFATNSFEDSVANGECVCA